MTVYICEHFIIEELVPPSAYKARGEKSWGLLDNRALLSIDAIRKRYGRMTCNNWKWGGDRQWSGLRTPDSPWFSPYSQHTFGRAFDLIPSDVSVDEIREDIINKPSLFPLIRGLELDVSWLHIDTRNSNTLKTFKA